MKRSFLYLALGALALTACTSEDVLEDAAKKHNAIGFENVVNKLSRNDVTAGNMEHFRVFGYYTTPLPNEEEISPVAVEVFNNIKVTRGQDGIWSYEDTNNKVELRYWVPGAHYYFYAYNCGNVDKLSSSYGSFSMDMTDGVRPEGRVLKINDYVCDNTHQHDLVYAYATGGTLENPFPGIIGKQNGNPLVAFQFKHLLTKVQASFTSKFPADYTVKISNVSLENICDTGTYVPNLREENVTLGWTNVGRANSFPSVYLLNTAAQNVNPISTVKDGDPAKTNAAFVIPKNYNGTVDSEGKVINNDFVYLKFFVTVENKGQVVFTQEMSGRFNPSWSAGYIYTYNVEISGTAANLQAIGFTTIKDQTTGQVVDWNTDDTPSIIIK